MYFDPGTGSMLIQILLGAIPVVGAFFIGLRKKLFKKKGEEGAVQEQLTADENPIPEAKASDGFEDVDDD